MSNHDYARQRLQGVLVDIVQASKAVSKRICLCSSRSVSQCSPRGSSVVLNLCSPNIGQVKVVFQHTLLLS